MTPEQADRQITWAERGFAWHTGSHGVCPVCREELKTTAITKLAYTFEVCHCPDETYPHLVEQLWHRSCFTQREAA
jgi:hypothetical protein